MHIQATWLGQAGLLLEFDALRVMIDPYLSDSIAQTDPKKHRRTPVDPAIWDVQPDMMIFTHDHRDHYDEESARRFLATGRRITVLSPLSVWRKVRGIGHHNCVLLSPGVEWTQGGVTVCAVPAAHSDPYAVGVLLKAPDFCAYVTGDTLYSRRVIEAIDTPVDVVLLPVNGEGNNMNASDAARFARAIGAGRAVPLHIGLFDDMTPEDFPFEGRLVLPLFRACALDRA